METRIEKGFPVLKGIGQALGGILSIFFLAAFVSGALEGRAQNRRMVENCKLKGGIVVYRTMSGAAAREGWLSPFCSGAPTLVVNV